MARKLASALEPSGYLLSAHPNQIVDEPDKPGFGWGGYTFSLTCRSGSSQFHDSHLALPRIGITGDDGLQEFAAKVGVVG